MAVTDREGRTRYDNIASGSATGKERQSADVDPAVTIAYGGGDNTISGTTARDPDNIASGETVNPYLENVAAGG